MHSFLRRFAFGCVLALGWTLSAEAATLHGKLEPGMALIYRFASIDESFSDVAKDARPQLTQHGFVTCHLDPRPAHGADAFTVRCEGGPEDSALSWRPWLNGGHYRPTVDGLTHTDDNGLTRLALPHRPEPTRWRKRTLLVLGEQAEAFCPDNDANLDTPGDADGVFQETCWSPVYGPLFFVGVASAETLAEQTWELVHVVGADGVQRISITERRAKKLIESWLWSQNTNRYQGYSWLYGNQFRGVLRGEAGQGNFDRTAWLKHHKPAFRRKADRRRAKDIKVMTVGPETIVLFDEIHREGDKSYRGPKELRLNLQGGRVVIAREEQLYAVPMK